MHFLKCISVANFKNCQMEKKKDEKCFDPFDKTTVYAFQNEIWNESSLFAGINNAEVYIKNYTAGKKTVSMEQHKCEPKLM